MKTLRQRLELLASWVRYDVDEGEGEIDDALDEILRETPNEDWQPLTADTVLPESGYVVLHHRGGYPELASFQTRFRVWANGHKDYGNAAELAADYTHYRVLRGPEET